MTMVTAAVGKVKSELALYKAKMVAQSLVVSA